MLAGEAMMEQWRIGRTIIGGGPIFIYSYSHHKNNLFQKKILIMQNTNIGKMDPPNIVLPTPMSWKAL